MGTYTTNYNLFMPSIGEQGWGDLVNGNFSTLDSTIKGLDTRTTALESADTTFDARLQPLEAGEFESITAESVTAESVNGNLLGHVLIENLADSGDYHVVTYTAEAKTGTGRYNCTAILDTNDITTTYPTPFLKPKDVVKEFTRTLTISNNTGGDENYTFSVVDNTTGETLISETNVSVAHAASVSRTFTQTVEHQYTCTINSNSGYIIRYSFSAIDISYYAA